MALILAGKVGSNIASEIGTMRVTEQIDAMEIMGVNSANFLILPKMLGLMIFIPVLVIFSMFTGIMGGIFASYSTSTGMTPSSFEYGLQFYFNEFYIWYSIIKSVVYAFIISSIAAYFGYNVKGGALEVGKASTNAVVMSSIMIFTCRRNINPFNAYLKMIEVKNITKSFDGRVVLKDISTTFEDGKTNLIIGRSGSGKTVMIKNIIGLMKPDTGQILYDGRDLITMNKHELNMLRREMGMLFQGSALFDSMTVMENVMFPLDMFSKDSTKERRKRAEFCLERVNLSEAGHLYPSEISGGMMKRAAIARAISLNPKYLFCDEPNSGLDPKTSLLIDDLIHDITVEYNMTTVINTHDMNSVMNIGDNIIFIKEGVKEWQGTKEQVITSNNQALNDFIFASDLFRKVKEVEMLQEEG